MEIGCRSAGIEVSLPRSPSLIIETKEEERMPHRWVVCLGAAASTVLVTAPAVSQTYPAKPIRLVVAQAAGSATDGLARVMSQELSRALHQQVIVDVRPGAGGLVGTELVAKSPPDGYTLQLATIATHGVNPALYKKLPYDAIKDFAAVTLATIAPNALIVHPSLPVRNTKELIALAKAKPGQLNFSSSGSGGAQHLAAELFRSMAGISTVHVGYRGTTPAMTALIAGEVEWMMPSLSSALPHMPAKKVRALAVTSSKRMPELPDVPTVAETVPGFEVVSWWGIVAPEGTPAPIIAQLNGEVSKVLAQPEVTKRLTAVGMNAATNTPQQFSAFIKGEVAKWAKVVRETRIELE
jgi:tripartite-type tricarboxylate transporter receptor subunit TctC